MQKIKNIEIYRFIFALIICYHHMIINFSKMFPDNAMFQHYQHMSTGGRCVDLFFIIAGYFLFYSILNCNSVLDLLIKKIKRLFPVFAFSLILISCFKLQPSELILNLAFLQSTSINLTRGINVAAWFVSTLVIVSGFYAGIVKSFNKNLALLIISICAFLGYSYLARHEGKVEDMANFYLTYGTIRGISGIGLGYLIAEFLTRKGEQIKRFICSTRLIKIIVTLFEITASIFIILFALFGKVYILNKFIIIIVFSLLFICLILKQDYFSKLLDNNVSVLLGKYAYSIYMMQAVYNVYAKKNFWKNYAFLSEHFALAIFLNLIGYILLGIITYHLIEKPPKKLIEIFNKLFHRGEKNV